MLAFPVLLQDLIVLALAAAAGWVLVRRFRRAHQSSGTSCPGCRHPRAQA